MKTDFTYILSEGFMRIYPENPRAVTEWNRLAKENGGCMNYPIHLESEIVQNMKRAGWTVKRKPSRKPSASELARIVEVLNQ